jgi:hypothetical protein
MSIRPLIRSLIAAPVRPFLGIPGSPGTTSTVELTDDDGTALLMDDDGTTYLTDDL